MHFSDLDSAQRSHRLRLENYKFCRTEKGRFFRSCENSTHRTGLSQNQQLVKAAKRIKSDSFSDNLVQKDSERKCLAGTLINH